MSLNLSHHLQEVQKIRLSKKRERGMEKKKERKEGKREKKEKKTKRINLE